MQAAAAYAVAAFFAVMWFLSARATVRALRDKTASQSLLNTAATTIHERNATIDQLREEISELKKIVDLSNGSA